jgi:hypothetical protein
VRSILRRDSTPRPYSTGAPDGGAAADSAAMRCNPLERSKVDGRGSALRSVSNCRRYSPLWYYCSSESGRVNRLKGNL